MDSSAKNWQKAHQSIRDAEYYLKVSSDLGDCILKNNKPPKLQRSFLFSRQNNQAQSRQAANPNEIEVVNINHHKEEQMGVITSYLQKYNSLENQIALFDAAKDQFLAEVNAERNFYNNLIKIREKYLIQDALLLNEFKHKAQKVKRKITGQSTLYCHIVKIPNLYYPKTQKNFLNKVLLIHGKKGELEYRCHPSLRKSMKLKTEIIFSVNKFNRQKQTFTWFLNGNNQDISHTNTQFIPSIIQKLKLLSLYR